MMFTLRQIYSLFPRVQMLGGFGHRQTAISAVSTDSRQLPEGCLFVAIRGDAFDGNEFALAALQGNAQAVIIDRAEVLDQIRPFLSQKALANKVVFLVPDCRHALASLASSWRGQFKLPLIAVTGSNGKTTVKEMIAAILRRAFEKAAFSTQGNLNNDIGVPHTLFRLNGSEAAGVIELGMNHPGEIAHLAQMVRPRIALVNNAQREHQEFMKTVEAVARENASVFESLEQSGVAVFPGDDEFTELWKTLAGARSTLCFGLGDSNAPHLNLRAETASRPEAFEMIENGVAYPIRLQILGQHNVRNALAAAACGRALGLDWTVIAEGLAQFTPAKGRLVAKQISTNSNQSLLLIDDSYNANPDSVLAAIQLLQQQPGPQCLVLGDMGEVGDQGPEFHREIGRAAKALPELMLVGDLTRYSAEVCPQAKHFNSQQTLLDDLLPRLSGFGTILVKGSRFMKMEVVVSAIAQAVEMRNAA